MDAEQIKKENQDITTGLKNEMKDIKPLPKIGQIILLAFIGCYLVGNYVGMMPLVLVATGAIAYAVKISEDKNNERRTQRTDNTMGRDDNRRAGSSLIH